MIIDILSVFISCFYSISCDGKRRIIGWVYWVLKCCVELYCCSSIHCRGIQFVKNKITNRFIRIRWMNSPATATQQRSSRTAYIKSLTPLGKSCADRTFHDTAGVESPLSSCVTTWPTRPPSKSYVVIRESLTCVQYGDSTHHNPPL